MGNIVTGSGSGEPSHPSVLSHEGVHSEKDRLTTRSLNTSVQQTRHLKLALDGLLGVPCGRLTLSGLGPQGALDGSR